MGEGWVEEPDRPTPGSVAAGTPATTTSLPAWRLEGDQRVRVSHSRLSQQSCDPILYRRIRSLCTPNRSRFLSAATPPPSAAERKSSIREQSLSCPIVQPPTIHCRFIAIFTMYTRTGATAEQVRKRGSRRVQEGCKTGEVSHQDE